MITLRLAPDKLAEFNSLGYCERCDKLFAMLRAADKEPAAYDVANHTQKGREIYLKPIRR